LLQKRVFGLFEITLLKLQIPLCTQTYPHSISLSMGNPRAALTQVPLQR